MWACRGSFQPWPLDNIITCTKPSDRRIFFVSAKFPPRRSRRQNPNFNYNLYDDDDENHDVPIPTTESEDTVYFESGDSGEQQQVPSGSDILRALQRAAVRKHNTKKKKQIRPASHSKAKMNLVSSSSGVDSPPLKPLRIPSDWTSRLDQLEQRLQELLQ